MKKNSFMQQSQENTNDDDNSKMLSLLQKMMSNPSPKVNLNNLIQNKNLNPSLKGNFTKPQKTKF